jgi:hypothetical protein
VSKFDILLYDLTGSYFESDPPSSLVTVVIGEAIASLGKALGRQTMAVCS